MVNSDVHRNTHTHTHTHVAVSWNPTPITLRSRKRVKVLIYRNILRMPSTCRQDFPDRMAVDLFPFFKLHSTSYKQ